MPWPKGMLARIGRGDLQLFQREAVPKSLLRGLGGGAGMLFSGALPEVFASLGVPREHGPRVEAALLLRQLLRSVPAAQLSEAKNKLCEPGAGANGNRYYWFALTEQGMKALRAAAQQHTPETLGALVSEQQKQLKISRAVQLQLAAQGLTSCETCTMPVLDTTDPDFERKAQLMTTIGSRDFQFANPCKCPCQWAT